MTETKTPPLCNVLLLGQLKSRRAAYNLLLLGRSHPSNIYPLDFASIDLPEHKLRVHVYMGDQQPKREQLRAYADKADIVVQVLDLTTIGTTALFQHAVQSMAQFANKSLGVPDARMMFVGLQWHLAGDEAKSATMPLDLPYMVMNDQASSRQVVLQAITDNGSPTAAACELLRLSKTKRSHMPIVFGLIGLLCAWAGWKKWRGNS